MTCSCLLVLLLLYDIFHTIAFISTRWWFRNLLVVCLCFLTLDSCIFVVTKDALPHKGFEMVSYAPWLIQCCEHYLVYIYPCDTTVPFVFSTWFFYYLFVLSSWVLIEGNQRCGGGLQGVFTLDSVKFTELTGFDGWSRLQILGYYYILWVDCF